MRKGTALRRLVAICLFLGLCLGMTGVSAGASNVNRVVPGDFDGDCQVTNGDVVYLLWSILYPESYPLVAEGNFNDDTVCDNEDVVYLLWYTLYPDQYPIPGGQKIPLFIQQEADRVAENIKEQESRGNFVMAALSDFHLYVGNQQHRNSRMATIYAGMGIRALARQVDISGVALLGDYTWGDQSYTTDQVKSDVALVERMLALDTLPQSWVVGNHDLNVNLYGDRPMTPEELYEAVGQKSAGIHPRKDWQRCYSYLDYEEDHIRVITLNTNDCQDTLLAEGAEISQEMISPTQLRWLADEALDFSHKENPGQWGVVLLSHHPVDYGYGWFTHLLQILEAYRDSSAVTLSLIRYKKDGTFVKERETFDFTGNTQPAQIICNLHGHMHNCAAEKVSSSTAPTNPTEGVDPWLWRIAIPNLCASRYNERWYSFWGETDFLGLPVYWKKEPATARATSFCLISIDREQERIYAHIFGAGKDRTFDYGT